MVTETKSARGIRLPVLLMILSAVTGLVDAISILGMGRVFTANMTGNVVFFGFAVGGAPGFEMMRYIVALVAFLLGAWAGGRIGKAHEGAPHRPWLLRVAFLEAGLFWAAALAAIGYDINTLAPTWSLYALIALTAVAMGLRNATVRQLRVPDMTTTVLTLTLTGLAANSNLAGGANPNWQRRIGGVLSVFVGAVIGAVLILHSGLVIPLIVTGLVVVVATISYALHPASQSPPPPAKT